MLAGQQDPTGQREKRSFYNEETAQKELATYVKHTVKDPLSPYQLMAGTVLPAVLITGIDSDLPGQVIAQTRENVYDTATGKIPPDPAGHEDNRHLRQHDLLVAGPGDADMVEARFPGRLLDSP